ncbi:MAG TPA: MoaD/ThiS family protein [Vicinamibacterales bacterium]|jgi:molybdopterin converting factor small subunit|nr:MoaD/ThiS family protein [Vicinamibacterales bacterium]
MAIVHFSGNLREFTGGVESIVVDAPRVQELRLTLAERFPALSPLLDELAVAVDDEIFQEPDYVTLEPDSEVHFVPRVSGG